MGLTSYVRDLPVAEQMAHRRLATVAQQWQRAGWGGEPIAVGVCLIKSVTDGRERLVAVYATANGVSVTPPGVTLPAALIALSRVPGINPAAVAALAGMGDPAEKLEKLIPPRFGQLVTVVTAETADVPTILAAGDEIPPQIPRFRGRRIGADENLQGAINSGLMRYGRPDLATAAAELRSLKWSSGGEKPARYDRALREWFFADALAAYGTNRDETSYAVGELELSPEIERDR